MRASCERENEHTCTCAKNFISPLKAHCKNQICDEDYGGAYSNVWEKKIEMINPTEGRKTEIQLKSINRFKILNSSSPKVRPSAY